MGKQRPNSVPGPSDSGGDEVVPDSKTGELQSSLIEHNSLLKDRAEFAFNLLDQYWKWPRILAGAASVIFTIIMGVIGIWSYSSYTKLAETANHELELMKTLNAQMKESSDAISEVKKGICWDDGARVEAPKTNEC